MAGILDLMGHVQQQGQLGRERGQQTRLGQLAGQSYTAPQDQRAGLLSQMATISPQAAQSQQQQFRAGDSDRVAQLSQKAKLFVGLAKTGNQQAIASLYPEIARGAREAFGVEVPDVYDPSFLAGIEQFANINGGGEAEQFTLSPGSARYDASGKLVVGQPFAPEKPQNATFQVDQEGNGWWLAPGQAPVPAFGGASPQQQGPQASAPNNGPGALDLTGDPSQWYASIGDIVKPFGGQIGSTTGGKHNIGSLHPGGNAVDIPLGDWRGISPENQQAMIDRLQSQPGIRVRDERQRPPGQKEWSGPHLHVERVAQAGGSGPKFGKRDSGPEETYSQPQVVTNPQTGKPELVQFGNRGGRRKVDDYAPGPTDRDAKPPTDGQLQAAGFYERMSSAERELEATVNAGYKPGNMRDFMTAGQGPLRNWAATDEGQKYRQQQEDWVRSKLRKESGAVIGDDEMEREIKVYFPQPGDSEAVITQKGKSRKIAIDAMKKNAGRALSQETQAPADDAGSDIDSLLDLYK